MLRDIDPYRIPCATCGAGRGQSCDSLYFPPQRVRSTVDLHGRRWHRARVEPLVDVWLAGHQAPAP